MKKKKLTQRVLAVLLSASMIFGAAPVSLQAEEIQGEVLEMSVEEPVVDVPTDGGGTDGSMDADTAPAVEDDDGWILLE